MTYFRALLELNGKPVEVADLAADPKTADRILASLRATGPAWRATMLKNHDPAYADMAARRKVLGAAIRHVLDGGREELIRQVNESLYEMGWRRIGSASVCDYCREYIDGDVIPGEAGRGYDFPVHDNCSCTVEPVFMDGCEEPADLGAGSAGSGSGGGNSDVPDPFEGDDEEPAGPVRPQERPGGPTVSEHSFHGQLGSVGDRHRPTLAAQLYMEGRVAPQGEPEKYYLPHERLLAQWLESLGIRTRSVKASREPGTKTPDAVVIGDGSTMELKEVRATVSSVQGAVRKARVQSRRVVLDLGATDEATSRALMDAALRKYGHDLSDLLVRYDEGRGCLYWKHG